MTCLCSLAHTLSIRTSMGIFHVIVERIAENALMTYDGLSNKICGKQVKIGNECRTESFDIVIIDAIALKDTTIREASNYVKDTGIVLVLGDTNALYKNENIANIFGGGMNYRLWYSFFKKDLRADDTILKIRRNEISKLVATITNLRNEVLFITPHTFEDDLFMGASKKILSKYISEINYMFASNQMEIKDKLEDIIKEIDNILTIPNTKNKLHKKFTDILKTIKKSPINENMANSPHETSVEIIVKNNMFATNSWEYQDKEQKMNFYNWYPNKDIRQNWFHRFVSENIPNRNKELNFFSCHGDDLKIRFMNVPNKIFYTMEDMVKRFADMNDMCLPEVDLAMCFNDIDNDKYLFFPYWLLCFEPIIDITAINKQIKDINSSRSRAMEDCAFIASHDMFVNRRRLVDALSDTIEIKCAGKFNHNDNRLKTQYNDDKLEYLKEFIFCACPENVNVHNYVTEKIFDAFKSGCIPIYRGSHNKPLPEFINQDAVLFFETVGDNSELKKTILKLKNNREFYEKFINQEKLKKGLAEYIHAKFNELKKRISEMCV